MAFASAAQLLDASKQLHLLDSGQLAQLAGPFADAPSLARDLAKRGWLTPFQINELFLGRGPQLLLGSYVLLEKLGEGGMGAVYKARNWKLDNIVALKLIRKNRLQNPNTVKRFYREIRAAAKLEHPHIVRAIDADEVAGTHLLVMELVDGIDLHRLVKEQGPLPVESACEYIRQAALGLQHAHEQGLVHRDIKPHNLLVASGQSSVASNEQRVDSSLATGHWSLATVKILDMGLARLTDPTEDGGESTTLTQEGAVMGTPDYIAPEQARASHTVDIRADLYSLGCTFYFLVTGKVPFPGGTSQTEPLVKPAAKPKSSDTAALGPGLVKPHAMPVVPAGRGTKIALVSAGLLLTVVLLIVTLRSFFGGSKPGPPEQPPVVQKKRSPLELLAEKQRKEEEAEKKRLAEEAEFQKKRAADADKALPPLTAKAADPKTTFVDFAKDVAAFKAKYGGTPTAIQAAQMLMKLPSPLDQLDPKNLPQDCIEHWKRGVRRRRSSWSRCWGNTASGTGERSTASRTARMAS